MNPTRQEKLRQDHQTKTRRNKTRQHKPEQKRRKRYQNPAQNQLENLCQNIFTRVRKETQKSQ